MLNPYEGDRVGLSAPQRVKWENERRVFQRIRQLHPVSRVDLGSETGLSVQAIGVIVRRLLDSGLVLETGPTPRGTVGKQPIGLEINPDGALAVGCNIERDQVDIAVVDLAGQLRGHRTFALVEGTPAETALRQIADAVRAAMAADPLGSKVVGIGVGVPGPVDVATGSVIRPPHFPGWETVAVRDVLRTWLEHPVTVDNSATAAAVGEAWRMRGEHPTFLYCHWGVGIGGGLIRDAEVYGGVTGNVMELGHILVNPHGALCHCGAMGCLEAEASWGSLQRTGMSWGEQVDLQDLAAAMAVHPWLAAWFERAAQYLGQALTTAVNLVDVDRVIIGGHHFEQARPWLLPAIQTWLAERAFRRPVRAVQVEGSELGEKAGAIGAATLVFQRWLPPTDRP